VRWFKHMTDMHTDPFIEELIEEYGMAGYGYWCMLLEIYARECGTDPGKKCNFSSKILRRKLRISSTKVEQFLNFCATKAKLLCNFSSTFVELQIPKMRTYSDDYTRKVRTNSGQTPTVEEEGEREENIPPNGGAKAPAENHSIWNDGLRLLVNTGLSEPKARTFLGRAIKDYGEGALNEAISATILNDPADPKSFLMGCLKQKTAVAHNQGGTGRVVL